VSLDTEVKSIVVDVVHKIRAESSVQEALKLMLDMDVGCLIVSKTGPIGILTERDVLRKVTGLGLDPAKTRVEDVMSLPLISVIPQLPLVTPRRR
jgi:CBS domain-containing protein